MKNRESGGPPDARDASSRRKLWGVSIGDRSKEHASLSFDLADILDTLGSAVLTSRWRLRNVEAIGAGAEPLHAVADQGGSVSGAELRSLADQVSQTIAGCFEAWLPNCAEAWIRVRAVDGAAFDVETEDPALLDLIRRRFKVITDLP